MFPVSLQKIPQIMENDIEQIGHDIETVAILAITRVDILMKEYTGDNTRLPRDPYVHP